MLDLIYANAVTLGGYAVIGLLFIFAKTRKRRKIKRMNSTKADMAKNKERQKIKEKELAKMGVFLCDKCGKKTAVRNAKSYGDFDLCPSCANAVATLSEDLAKAEEAYKKACEAFRLKKLAFSEALKGCNVTREETETKTNEAQNVVDKLGIGG